jgi:hypothetical protein
MKLTDGLYDEDNAKYLKVFDISKRMKYKIPYIMHWAGIKYKRISDLPYPEILIFYKDLYFCAAGPFARIWNDLLDYYWFYEKKIKENLKLRFKKLILQYGN